MPLIASVTIPVLAVLGARERASRDDAQRELTELKASASRARSFTTAVVDADHLYTYTGAAHAVAREIGNWVAAQC